MVTDTEIDDAIQAYLTEQCYGEGAQPDGLMIAAEAGWRVLRARIAELEAALSGVEWVAEYTPEGAIQEEWCPECGHRRSLGHTPYCALGAALAAAARLKG